MNWLILIIVIILASVGLVFDSIKSWILYHPTHDYLLSADEMAAQIGGRPYQVQEITIPNGTEQLEAWFFKYGQSTQPEDKKGNQTTKTVVICHGNGGNLSYRQHLVELLAHCKVNICLFDYQGYGHSTGDPSESKMYRDGQAIVEYLCKNLSIPLDSIVFLGESIGSGTAAFLAQKYQSPQLILLSGFTSIREMFEQIVDRNVPSWCSFLTFFGCFFREFPTNEYLCQFHGETLILHSPDDHLVPYQMAVKNAQNPRCSLVNIGGGHNDPVFSEESCHQLSAFLGRH